MKKTILTYLSYTFIIVYVICSVICINSLKSDNEYTNNELSSLRLKCSDLQKETDNYKIELSKLKLVNFEYICEIMDKNDIQYNEKIKNYILDNSSLNKNQVDQIVKYLFDTAKKYSIDPLLIIAVMEIESGFRIQAISKSGAKSLLQVTKIAEKEVKFQYENIFVNVENDIHKNILTSVSYLSFLLNKYNDIVIALESYRIGPSKMDYLINNKKNKIKTEYVFKILSTYAKIRAECLIDEY